MGPVSSVFERGHAYTAFCRSPRDSLMASMVRKLCTLALALTLTACPVDPAPPEAMIGVSADSEGTFIVHFRSCTRPVRSIELSITEDGSQGRSIWKIRAHHRPMSGSVTLGQVPPGFEERMRLATGIPKDETLVVSLNPHLMSFFFHPSEVPTGQILTETDVLPNLEDFAAEADEACAAFG